MCDLAFSMASNKLLVPLAVRVSPGSAGQSRNLVAWLDLHLVADPVH